MSQPPAWLSVLVDVAGKAMEPLDADVLAPLGCHYTKYEGVWEITLFIEATETIGGPLDGSIRRPPFGVRICDIMNVFQNVTQCHWQSHTLDERDELGPHLSIEGIYKGRTVWLRILAQAPQQFPPRRVATGNAATQEDW